MICLSWNSYSQELTKIVVVNKPIKYVYRVALESLNKCDTSLINLFYIGLYYDDNDTASIYPVGKTGDSDLYKLRKIDKDSTEISYYKDKCIYCSAAKGEAKLEKTLLWIKDGDRDCQFVTAPSNQTM